MRIHPPSLSGLSSLKFSVLKFSCSGLLAMTALWAPQAFGASVVFNVGNGDWNTASNWQISGTTPWVPTGTDTAFIRGNRTANVTSAVPTVQVVSIANAAGNPTLNIASTGTLNINNGTNNALTIGASTGVTGTLNVNGGLLSVIGNSVIGNTSGGIVNVNSGTYTSNQSIRLGISAGSSGALNVAGGLATVGTSLSVGVDGAGSVLVSGGTLTTSTATVASGVGSTGSISVTAGRLQVSSTDDVFLGGRVTGTTSGAYTQSGGEVSLGGGDGRLVIGSTNGAGQVINSSATISGGNFSGRFLIGANTDSGAGNGVLTIVGDAATIGSAGTTGTGLELRATGEIVFQLDATGISTLDFSDLNVSMVEGSKLTIDGTAYAGGAQIFTLIDAESFTGDFALLDKSVFGFAPGYSTNLFLENNDVKLEILGIPEPSTWALLGLGLGVLIWRTRERRVKIS